MRQAARSTGMDGNTHIRAKGSDRSPPAPARLAAPASDPYLRHGILLHILIYRGGEPACAAVIAARALSPMEHRVTDDLEPPRRFARHDDAPDVWPKHARDIEPLARRSRMQAYELTIDAKVKPTPFTIVSADDFHVQIGRSIDPHVVLEQPTVSLYCLDHAKARALFVDTPPAVDLLQAPFYFIAQYEAAQRFIAVPYATQHSILFHRQVWLDPGQPRLESDTDRRKLLRARCLHAACAVAHRRSEQRCGSYGPLICFVDDHGCKRTAARVPVLGLQVQKLCVVSQRPAVPGGAGGKAPVSVSECADLGTFL